MASATVEKGQRNDFDGLHFIQKFCWLRPAELAQMLWPSSPHARKNMSKLLAKWRKNRYVIERKLPENLGTALVLARAGAEMLKRNDVEDARSGKDWGEPQPDGSFRPPGAWRHQLLQAGLAVVLMRAGYEIYSEPDLKAWDIDSDSIPDLLAKKPDSNYWIWCEVENARKTGRVRRRRGYQDKLGAGLKLAHTLRYAARGTSVGPFEVRGALVAYDKDCKDERGHRLDHEKRIAAALTELCKGAGDTVVNFVALTMSGGSIESVATTTRKF